MPRERPEVDTEALREFEALSQFLSGLSRQELDEDRESLSPVLGSLDRMEQTRRWLVTLRGVQRLTEVAAVRELLLQAPSCVDARVTALSSEAINLVVTTTAQIDHPQARNMLDDALSRAGSHAVCEVVIQPTGPAV